MLIMLYVDSGTAQVCCSNSHILTYIILIAQIDVVFKDIHNH